MCKVIVIGNQKGGVGKTTTTSNLGIGLAKKGKKVLLIDADAQGSLTASLGFQEPDKLDVSLATIMANIINEEDMEPDYGILKHDEGVDLMPGNIELSGLEVSLVNVMSRELVLRTYIEQQKERYDYILIDCMPSLGMITINAFASADSILIPVQAAYLPVKGLEQLIKTIGKVKRQINPKLEIERVLFKVILPLAFVAVWLNMCYWICLGENGVNWFQFWIMSGFPFGIQKMLVLLIPRNFGIAGSIGVLALDAVIGGMIGVIVLAIKIIAIIREVINIIMELAGKRISC